MQEQRAAFDAASAQLRRIEEFTEARVISQSEITQVRSQYEKGLAGWSKAVEAALDEIAAVKPYTP